MMDKQQASAQNTSVQSVAVYCSSSTHLAPIYYAEAVRLGALLAQNGITLVNGGGCMGLMNAASNGCLEAGGKVIGIIPQFMVEEGWHHSGLTELRTTPDMRSRKAALEESSDGAMILPGGIGTFDEMMEILALKQLGQYTKPVVILNTRGYFDPLLCMLEKGVEERFIREEHSRMWHVAATPEEAVSMLLADEQQNFSKL